jgi:hypothetical protein
MRPPAFSWQGGETNEAQPCSGEQGPTARSRGLPVPTPHQAAAPELDRKEGIFLSGAPPNGLGESTRWRSQPRTHSFMEGRAAPV